MMEMSRWARMCMVAPKLGLWLLFWVHPSAHPGTECVVGSPRISPQFLHFCSRVYELLACSLFFILLSQHINFPPAMMRPRGHFPAFPSFFFKRKDRWTCGLLSFFPRFHQRSATSNLPLLRPTWILHSRLFFVFCCVYFSFLSPFFNISGRNTSFLFLEVH